MNLAESPLRSLGKVGVALPHLLLWDALLSLRVVETLAQPPSDVSERQYELMYSGLGAAATVPILAALLVLPGAWTSNYRT